MVRAARLFVARVKMLAEEGGGHVQRRSTEARPRVLARKAKYSKILESKGLSVAEEEKRVVSQTTGCVL